MPNNGPIGYARITNFMMNVFIGIVLGIVLLALTSDLSSTSLQDIVRSFSQSLVMSVLVGYAVGDYLPTMQLAQALAEKMKVVGVLRHVVIGFVLGLVNVTVILSVCMFTVLVKEVGIAGVAAAIVSLWPWAVGSGIVSIILFLPLSQRIAAKVSDFTPEGKA